MGMVTDMAFFDNNSAILAKKRKLRYNFWIMNYILLFAPPPALKEYGKMRRKRAAKPDYPPVIYVFFIFIKGFYALCRHHHETKL
ncbi:MAG: hypothetical protein LBD07_04130 [Spirochaetaceae bacterium]|jgi:hypothetical protein|nr:hypothetical protein [Spirochaetaceae bacterium]